MFVDMHIISAIIEQEQNVALCGDVPSNEYNVRRGGGNGYLELDRGNHVGLRH